MKLIIPVIKNGTYFHITCIGYTSLFAFSLKQTLFLIKKHVLILRTQTFLEGKSVASLAWLRFLVASCKEASEEVLYPLNLFVLSLLPERAGSAFTKAKRCNKPSCNWPWLFFVLVFTYYCTSFDLHSFLRSSIRRSVTSLFHQNYNNLIENVERG